MTIVASSQLAARFQRINIAFEAAAQLVRRVLAFTIVSG
jgi:hypothetical protein